MSEVVTMDEIKTWLKIDNTADDYVLDALRVSCIDYAESYTGLYFIERDESISFAGLQNSRWESFPYIDIPKPLISSLTKIESIVDSETTVVSGTYYTFRNVSNIGRVIFTTTPSYDIDKPYPFTVYFTAGFGDTAEDVPELIKTAIKLHIAYLYENRGDVQSDGGLFAPLETTALLNKYKVRYIF